MPFWPPPTIHPRCGCRMIARRCDSFGSNQTRVLLRSSIATHLAGFAGDEERALARGCHRPNVFGLQLGHRLRLLAADVEQFSLRRKRGQRAPSVDVNGGHDLLVVLEQRRRLAVPLQPDESGAGGADEQVIAGDGHRGDSAADRLTARNDDGTWRDSPSGVDRCADRIALANLVGVGDVELAGGLSDRVQGREHGDEHRDAEYPSALVRDAEYPSAPYCDAVDRPAQCRVPPRSPHSNVVLHGRLHSRTSILSSCPPTTTVGIERSYFRAGDLFEHRGRRG